MTCAVVLAALLLVPASAAATEQYRLATHACTVDGGGQFDNQGTLYLACGKKVMRWDSAGKRLADVDVWATATDVAPGPDGQWIWVRVGGDPFRMNRQKDGRYTRDTNWKAEPFPSPPLPCNVSGKFPPRGRAIASDAFGNLYVSNGGWVDCTPNVITRHGPDGKLLNKFGEYGDGAMQFRVNMGVAASMDGRTIYTVEHTNSRIQRFDWSPRGEYEFTTMWGTVDDVDCATGKFAAPYDVGLDPWGYVYVQDTSCRRIQKFTPFGGFLVAVQVEKLSGGKAHGMAVDSIGNATATQVGKQIIRETPSPGPWPPWEPLPPPDREAPTLESLIVPEVSESRDVDIQLAASDNAGVADMRFADENGEWGPWLPYADRTSVRVTAGFGLKAITAQVRDEAWNESSMLTRTVHFREAPDLGVPAIESVEVPATVQLGEAVQVTVAASDDRAVTGLRTADETGTWAAWQAYEPQVTATPTGGAGIKGIYIQVRDAAGNESVAAYRTYRVIQDDPADGNGNDGGNQDQPPDDPEPQPGEDDGNGNVVPPPGGADAAAPVIVDAAIPPFTTANTVTLTVNAADDVGVTMMRTANEDGNWKPWRPFAAESQHALSAGMGLKAVFVQVRDAAGNESAARLLRTKVYPPEEAPPPGAEPDPDDKTAPELADLQIPAASPAQMVAVGVVTAADDASQMRFANEDGNWGPWIAYAPEHQHELSAGYGAKGVFAQLRDASGNESNVLFRTLLFAEGAHPDAAAADVEDPVMHGLAVPDPATTGEIRVVVDATDDTQVTGVRLANEDGEWGPWQPLQPELVHRLSAGTGHKAVYGQVRDAAGRESNIVLVRLTRTA